jgi:hypothetical protein
MPSVISAGTTSGTSLNLSADTSGVLQLATNGTTTAVTIDTSQNVGIGTSSPTQRLDIAGSGMTLSRIRGGASNGQGAGYFVANSTGTSSLIALADDSTINGGTPEVNMSVFSTRPLLFYSNSAERMRITSGGDVGIGTNSPTSFGGGYKTLEVKGSTSGNGGVFRTATSDNSYLFDMYTNTNGGNFETRGAYGIIFTTNGSERMRIDSSGNVCIGTTTAQITASGRGNITLNGSSSAIINMSTGDVNKAQIFHGGTDMFIGNQANGYLMFQTNATERMRITSGGNVWIGTTSSSFGSRFAVEKNGGDVVGFGNTNVVAGETVMTVKGGVNTTDTTTTYIIFQRSDGTTRGTIVATGTNGVVYNTSSDYRLKENIEPMTGALAKVQALNPVTYKWKEDGLDGQGFVAHELAEVFPDAVTGEKDAVNEDGSIKPQGIDTSVLVATLAAAIKELNAKVEAQAAEIELLKSK